MKKLIVLFVLLILVIPACNTDKEIEPHTEKENLSKISTLFKSVKPEEYKKASYFQKRLINQIDAAVNALDILSQDTHIQYEAMVSVSKNVNEKFSNSLLIAPIESSHETTNTKSARVSEADGKCHVCGMTSAWSCIKEVEEYMNKKSLDEIDVHVKRTSDGCVDITYK